MSCNTSKNAGLNTGSTAAILRNQVGNDPPVTDEKKATANFPSPSPLRRSFTPSPGVTQSPKSQAPLSHPEPPILQTPAGNTAPTGPTQRGYNSERRAGTKLNRMYRPIDKHAFIKYMKNTGRAYRKQAKELVSISLLLVRSQNQTFDSDANRSLEKQVSQTIFTLCLSLTILS